MDITKLNVDFYNLQCELRKFPAAGDPLLDTVIESIAALIRDLYNHYSPSILRAPVADYAVLCGSMYAVADLLCDLHDAHQEKIQELGGGDLPDQFQDFTQKLLDTQSRILDQEGQLQALEAAKAELQTELDREKRSLAQLQAEQNQLTALNDELSRIIGQISGIDLPGLKDRKAALEAQKSELEQQKAGHNAAIAQLEDAIAPLDSECTRLSAALERSRQQFAAATALRKQLEQELTQTNADEAAEKQRAAGLSNAISAGKGRLQALQGQVAQLNDTLTQLLAEEAAAAAEESRLSGEVQAAQARKAVLDQKTSDHKQILADLANVEADIAAAEASLAEAQQSLEQGTADRDALQASICGIQASIQALSAESEVLEPQVRAAEATRLEHQNIRDGLISTLTQAQTQAKALEAQALELQQQLTDTNTEADGFRSQITELGSQIEEAKLTHKELLIQVYTLEQELAYQTDRNNAYRLDPLQTTSDQLDLVRQEYTELTLRLKSLTESRDSLVQKRSQIDSECATIEVLTKILQSKVDEAQRELNGKTLAHGSKERELAEINKQISIRVDGMKELLDQIEAAKALLANLDPVATKAKYTQTLSDLDREIAAVEQMKEDLVRAENELSASRCEYNRLRSERDAARSEYQSLETQLRILRDPATTEETARLRNRIAVMNQICDKLTEASGKLGLTVQGQLDPRSTVQLQLEYARSTLIDLSGSIEKYQHSLTDFIPANL